MSDRYPEIQALYDSRYLGGQMTTEQSDQSFQHRMYAGHALFSHQDQSLSQRVPMNMAHMAEGLPFNTKTPRTQLVSSPYYQQLQPPVMQYSQVTPNNLSYRRSYPPQGPAILPFNNMTASTPYPVSYSNYQPSPQLSNQYSMEEQGRAQAQHSYAMSKDNPPTPYNYEMPTYPFHMAQVMQDRRFSSSGSNATAGSSPAATHGSSQTSLITENIFQGPPRKPRQSGHALWVGNLPPTANVSDLKDHFSRGLTTDIESLKLLAKSNCAFVNYHTAAACATAMQKFHDSRFHGTRLVCRLRRTSDPSAASKSKSLGSPSHLEDGVEASDNDHDVVKNTTEKAPERFFVLKSLTVQDLETSLRTGSWTTQSHNEVPLNTAYTTSDNVFLIFSANKSGEYFGYARMTSAISSSETVLPTLTPQSSSGSSQTQYTPPSTGAGSPPQFLSSPSSISTSATEWAPSGKIIEDHARGTIFWEADLVGDAHSLEAAGTAATNEGDALNRDQPQKLNQVVGALADSIDSGRSFTVDWISTAHVPFYTTRGLRNPWNLNREVKIARDGTELEPSVGRKLLDLFSNPGIGKGTIPVC